jgi:putative hydrolase
MSENLRAAEDVGLRALGLVDHVRKDTPWVQEFVAEARLVGTSTQIHVECGLEAKMLDTAGNLDLPPDYRLADYLVVADHQLPTPQGPMDPALVKDMLSIRELAPAEVIGWLIEATAGALSRHQGALIAHPFSLLPKLGLAPSEIRSTGIDSLVSATADSGGRLEISERWRCPEEWIVRRFLRAEIPVVASTDSHRASAIGRYDYCRKLIEELAAPGPVGAVSGA